MLECCALALLASGRPVTREGLVEMCELAGVQARDDEIGAVLLLVHAARATRPEGDDLRSAVKRLAESVAELGRRVAETRGGETVPVAGEPSAKAPGNGPSARYIYGVVDGGQPCRLKTRGVGGVEVYAVEEDGLAAVVHACGPEPYSTTDDDAARAWVEAHNSVLQECLDTFESVAPCTFNTILHDENHTGDPDDLVRGWLKLQGQDLRLRLDRLRGKREFGVQVLYRREAVVAELLQADPDLAALKRSIEEKSPGAAYMLREKLERTLKEKLEAVLLRRGAELLEQVRPHCADLKVEKCKKGPDEYQMLANWSCLLTREGERAIGAVLEEVRSMCGYEVRFVGPLPPYSFV